MLQGTKNTDKGYICVSCNEVIAQNVEDITNYCSNCGAPLKLNSIIESKKASREEKLALIEKIETWNKEGAAFSKIIENIKFDINNL